MKLGHSILKMQIRYEPDIVTARQKTRRISQLLGFDSQDQARLSTAVSELARNVYQYAKTGTIEFLFSETSQSFFVQVSDSGPGIANLSEILNGTYVSENGMGVGLLGSKKLMDFFEIDSKPGEGTRIVIGKNLDRRSPYVRAVQLPKLADQLIVENPENPFEEIQNQNRDLLTALEEVRKSKEELAQLNQELAETNRGVVALYAELDEKASSLQRANEVKTSFLSNMTHEFRTPLSSIISLTRLLLDRVDGELSPEQERQVTYIRQSGESLLELVNDLLDLAKVEAGKVSVTAVEFSFEELLGGLRGMFRPLLNNHPDVEFSIDWDPQLQHLNTDQGKVSQILRNLISNAIKYTEKGSVKVSAKPGEGDTVIFSVTDTGIGIAPEHLEKVFEDFSQVDSKVQRKQKGTGLGLPLSQKLARILGGDIRVESKLNQGSVFSARIPRIYTGNAEAVLFQKENTDHQDPQDAGESLAGTQFKILLIDDDEPSRYVLRNLLLGEIDADFIECQNGAEGLEKIKSSKTDLVFLDLTMPELDGFEVLKAIRSDDQWKDVPVIVNTAKKMNESELEFLKAHATAVLSKERTDQKLAIRDLRRALVKAGFDYRGM